MQLRNAFDKSLVPPASDNWETTVLFNTMVEVFFKFSLYFDINFYFFLNCFFINRKK